MNCYLLFLQFVVESCRLIIYKEGIYKMKKLICMILAVFLLVSLAACQDAREGDYVLATNALESGRYADAYPILAELGDYKDAKALLATIHAEKQSAVVDIDGVHMEIEYVIKNGNVVKEIRTVSGGDQIKSYYKFNAEGLCTSEIHAQADGSKVNINHFYEGSTPVRTVRTNANGLKDTFVYTCDENNKVVSHVLTFSDGGVQEATYTYNEQGLLATLACTGAGEETLTYEYNVYGDVEKETSVNPFGESVTKYNYTYSYTVG